MSNNPYQSPTAGQQRPMATLPNRQSSQRTFRIAILILLAPALFNYYAFDTHLIANGSIVPALQNIYRAANIAGIVLATVLIWLFGLSFLEHVSTLTRSLFARHVAIDAWNDAIYASLKPAVILAIPGAFLWGLWVIGFYYLEVDFVTISYVIGIPSHLLLACLYVPLLVRWYKLVRTESRLEDPRTNG